MPPILLSSTRDPSSAYFFFKKGKREKKTWGGVLITSKVFHAAVLASWLFRLLSCVFVACVILDYDCFRSTFSLICLASSCSLFRHCHVCWAFMSQYFILSFRSFCLLKVAHLWQLYFAWGSVALSFRFQFGSIGYLIVPLTFPSYLSSLWVSLGILSSSLLGISLSYPRAHFSPLHHSFLGSPTPLLPFLSSLFLLLLQPFSTTCSARSRGFYSPFALSFSFLCPAASPVQVLLLPSSLLLPFPPFSSPLFCFLLPLRSPACGILLSSLHLPG